MNIASRFVAISRIESPSELSVVRCVTDFIAQFESLDGRSSLLCLKSIGKLMSNGHVNARDSRIRNVTELALCEISRQITRLTANDICDTLCVGWNGYLVSRFMQNLASYKARQVALCVWSLGRRADSTIFDSVYQSVMSHLLSNPRRLTELRSRDWALILYAGTSNTSKIKSLGDHIKGMDRMVSIIVSENVKFKSFRELAMMMYSLGKLRSIQKSLNLDSSCTESAVNTLLPQLSEILRKNRSVYVVSESSMSTASLLACLYGLGNVGFKAQPLLVDLFRIIYRRADSMTVNQCAFAFYLFMTKSGLSDTEISNRLLVGSMPCESLSNTNLVNVIQALSRSEKREESRIFFDQAKSRKMSPDQRVACIEAAVELMSPQENALEFWQSMLPPTIKNLKQFSPKLLVRLYVCQRLLGGDSGIKNAISVSLIHRLKEHNHTQWGHEELLTFAAEIGRVISGPYSANYHPIKPNLKERFFRHLWISIKHRRIPTHMLMHNLVLLDQIGTFRRLPYDLRLHLWNKALDHQKPNIAEPVPPKWTPNSWKKEWMYTSKLLVRIPTKEEQRAMWDKYKQEQAMKKQKADTEKLELSRSALAGEKTPIAQFIDTIREMK